MVRLASLAARPLALRCCRSRTIRLSLPSPWTLLRKQQFATQNPPATKSRTFMDKFEASFNFPPESDPAKYVPGELVTLHGFLGKRRNQGQALTFCPLETSSLRNVQIVAAAHDGHEAEKAALAALRSIPHHSPVAVTGVLAHRYPRVKHVKESDPIKKVAIDAEQTAGNGEQPAVETEQPAAKTDEQPAAPTDPNTVNRDLAQPHAKLWDLKLTSVQCLNPFPNDVHIAKDAGWSPKQRHLQLRNDSLLRDRIVLRESLTASARRWLREHRFREIETPLLFKSTPEGAREFLVPTRQKGLAYALPQSPQQYKQLLMSGGFRRYFQFARCFRDEDHRADRQPEFTQLDLEMSFATGQDVMDTIESLVSALITFVSQRYVATPFNGSHHLAFGKLGAAKRAYAGVPDHLRPYELRPPPNKFPVYTYDEVMTNFGTDKPDLRDRSRIYRIDDIVPSDFVSMITKLDNPIVEAMHLRLAKPQEARRFIHEFMDNLPRSSLQLSGDGTPGVFVIDDGKPLQGLASFGFEAVEKLQDKYGTMKLLDGDILIVQARKRADFRGEGWTDLGKLRRAIQDAARAQQLVQTNHTWGLCWVTKFPLFTPTDADSAAAGEGQGGSSGFSSTHHPFTAPCGPEDFDHLETNPLLAKGDHYDLICRGVEIGGGSRRIHDAEMQTYIMRDVLGMSDAGVNQFRHLLDALKDGCPPHAGFAMGWDRFVTVLCGVDSVTDVLAFPKNSKGYDHMVGSPSKLTDAQSRTYHLAASGYKPKSSVAAVGVKPSDVPIPGDEPLPGSVPTGTGA